MKCALILALTAATLAAATLPASAISRIRADQTTCGAILDRIDREGAVLLRYPSKRVANYILYDRYVAGDRFCDWPDQESRLDPVATKDTGSCPVMTCQRRIKIFPPPFGQED